VAGADGKRPRLELRGIRKVYPSVVANDGIDLAVTPGEIHAVLGENGAGKSTLMKIIYGVTRQTEGEMFWEGQPVTPDNPAHARSLGIGMVFQHFSLFETLTVVENVALALPGAPDLGDLSRRIEKGLRRNTGCPSIRAASCMRFRSASASASRSSGACCRTQAPHHGRADVGADAAGRAQAVRDVAAARGGGLQHPLHQPQAGRDPGALSHGDGLARRQGHRALHTLAGDAQDDGAPHDRQGSSRLRAQPGEGGRRGSGFASRAFRTRPTIPSAPI
jgi:hypothetical protein